jgi:hypothetical protein
VKLQVVLHTNMGVGHRISGAAGGDSQEWGGRRFFWHTHAPIITPPANHPPAPIPTAIPTHPTNPNPHPHPASPAHPHLKKK